MESAALSRKIKFRDARDQAKAGVSHPNLYTRQNSPFWWARVQVGGTDKRVSLRTADFQEALTILSGLMQEANEVRQGRQRPPEPIWQDAVDAFIRDEIEPGKRYSPKAAARHECSIRKLSAALENEPLSAITRETVWDYVRARREANSNISVSTLLNDLSAWSQVMAHAVDLNLCTDNPPKFFNRKALGTDISTINPPTDEELAVIVHDVEGWNRDMALLMVWLRETGMRLNEALSLHVSDIRPDRATATLRHGVKRNKDGLRVRTIDLTDGARAVLAVLDVKAVRVFRGLHEDSAVVSTRYGQWCRQRQGREERAAKAEKREAVSLTRYRLHDLRHAFAVASMVRDATCSYRLQLHLGHTTITTTERYSGHVQREGYNRGPSDRGWFGTLYGWLPAPGTHMAHSAA